MAVATPEGKGFGRPSGKVAKGEVGDQANRTPSAAGAQAGSEAVLRSIAKFPRVSQLTPLLLRAARLSALVGSAVGAITLRNNLYTDEYLARALEAVEEAAGARSKVARAQWLTIAEAYRELAARGARLCPRCGTAVEE